MTAMASPWIASATFISRVTQTPRTFRASQQAAAPSRNAMDAVVIKIEARTGRLTWATRVGGSSWDAAGDLTAAPDGSIYVLGFIRKSSRPTAAARSTRSVAVNGFPLAACAHFRIRVFCCQLLMGAHFE